MNGDNCLGNDLAGHLTPDLDARDSHPAEAIDIGSAFDDHVFSGEAAGNSPREVNGRRVITVQITAEFAFD